MSHDDEHGSMVDPSNCAECEVVSFIPLFILKETLYGIFQSWHIYSNLDSPNLFNKTSKLLSWKSRTKKSLIVFLITQ